jgi:diguanylate cyclase (GGDEF)-like protein
MQHALKTVLTSARQSLEQTFPPAMSKLLQELVKPEPSFEAIARIISLDPAMTVAVLNLVNSPFYGLSQGVTNLERAAVVLGTREILKIALSVSYLESRQSAAVDTDDAFCNWRMVVWSAVAAGLMAERAVPDKADKLYLCTLLKDISLIALSGDENGSLPPPPKVPLTCLRPGQLEAEREIWSVDHAELSAQLLRLWDIPDIGCDSIRHHHDLDDIERHPVPTRIVILATRWAELANDCHGMNAPEELVHHEAFIRQILGLTREEMEELRAMCLTRFRSMLSTIHLSEVPKADRLYEHSLQDMQTFHLQAMEIASADGGTHTVARTLARHLRWNFALSDWDLCLSEPGQHRWSLYQCHPEDGVTASGAAEQLADLPWRDAAGDAHQLIAVGDKWGEIRFPHTGASDDIMAKAQLYLRFVSRSLERYNKRQAVLVSKARTLDNLPVGVARLDAESRVWEMNQKLYELLGYPQNPQGRLIIDCLHEIGSTGLGRDWTDFLSTPSREAFSKVFCLQPSGDTPPRCVYLSAHKQDKQDILFMIEDVTEVSSVEMQALRQGAFLEQVISSMRDVVLTTDARGVITFASPEHERHLVGKNLFTVATPVDENDGAWDASRLHPQTTSVEVALDVGREKPLPLEMVISLLVGTAGEQATYLVVGRDLTDIRRLEEKLRRQAVRDGLTGLFNHYQFHSLLEREAQRFGRTGRPLGLLFFDLDGFKAINDTHGHQAGDDVLKGVAQILRHTVRRGTDYPCRYGGDEFAVIVTETSEEGMRTLAQRIHEAVNTRFKGAVGLSMGAALLGEDERPADLLRRADQGTYAAKAVGGNRIHWME